MAETVKGINVQLGLDTSELDSGLKKINDDLRKEKDELTKINKALKFDENNIDLWKSKQSQLNNVINETKTRLELNNKKLLEAKRAASDISNAEFNALEKAVAKDIASLEKLNLELSNTNKEIQKLGMQNLKNIENIGNKLTTHLTGPIIAATTALGGLSVKLAQNLDDLSDNAEKIGLNAEEYQKWNYAAEIMAVETTTLQRAFVKVNDLLADIAVGASSSETKLNLLGLSVEQLSGKSTSEALLLISDSLNNLGSEAEKVAAINAVFGERIGSELVPLLGLTSEGINNLFENAEKLGVASNEQAKIAGVFTDRITDLKLAFTNLGNNLQETLIPILLGLIDNIINNLLPKLNNIVDKINELDETTLKVIGTISGLLAAVGPVLLVVAKIPLMITNITKGITVLKSGLTALMAHPIILLISAVVSLLAILYKRNEAFRNSINHLISIISKALQPVLSLITNILGNLFNMLGGILDILGNNLSRAIEMTLVILQPLIDVLTFIWNLVSDIIDGILEIITFGFWTSSSERENKQSLSSSASSAIRSSSLGSITSSSTSNVDNSTNTYNINIESNDYTTAEEVADMLALKLQARG